MSASHAERNFPVLRVADEPGKDDPAEARKRMLKQLAERLDQHHAFAKGQFVAWKPGLKNKTSPDYGEPAIVTAVLPTPVFDQSEASAGSPYFQEPLSIVIGIHREDDLLEFRVAAASSRSTAEPRPHPSPLPRAGEGARPFSRPREKVARSAG
ncbi:MAG TPA: hypothetical protein VKG91_02725 [Roseiarcus sp.]|nr:hypothetical protein [Roseiarcus sp.]